jgi:tRNA-binding protein
VKVAIGMEVAAMPRVPYTALRPGAWKSRFMVLVRPVLLRGVSVGCRFGGSSPLRQAALLRRTRPEYSERMSEPISYADFERVDIRVGTITDAQPFPEARKPAIRLWVDFGGEIGVKRSSAQLTVHYSPDRLIGRQVVAVVNFPPRQIGPVLSEVLVLGVPDENGAVVLLKPDLAVPKGGKMF